MAVSFDKTDLQYILRQIQMAEANQPPVSPHLAFGLRALDGTNNNTVPGQSAFGSNTEPFANATDPLLQNQYAGPGTVSPNSFVVDAAPRLISNLIADISQNNPAALQAAQDFAAQLGDGYTAFSSNPTGLILPGADGVFGTADDNWGFGKDGIAGNADDLWGADGALGGGDDLAAVDKNNLFIGNVTPDSGLSAPFNNWMTFFGQFFDHGLDLISKGGNGYIYIPLAADDPLRLVGPDGIAGTGDEVPAGQAFMLESRASRGPGADGILGTSDDTFTNQTSPFVDQSQTYGSDGSHNAFLREYIVGVDGALHTTGKMLQHTTGAGLDGLQGDNQATLGVDESVDDVRSGMATWADLKANALKFGLIITDKDVGDVPLLATDAYGNFIPGPTGHVQVVVNVVGGASPGSHLIELNPTAPLSLDGVKSAAEGLFGGTATVLHTGHAFINDMNHSASPFDDFGNPLQADTDSVVGLANADASSTAGFYDDELLDAHYVAGDGRINENIALTTVHEIFHDEHNRLVDQTKALVQAELNGGDTGFAQDWVLAGVDLTVANGVDGAGNPIHIIQDNEWNGERVMQAAKFGTETQYQHLVFEEFARKIAPTIHLFGNVDIHLDASITSEFANAVYRFGHSMLDENVAKFQLNPDGTPVIGPDGQPVLSDLGLIEAFTNPLAYAKEGADGILGTADDLGNTAAEIIQGTTHQIGSEIDEFVTGSLRNNLLGLPLDLAALNIARGRETGVAPLNLVRAQIYDATHDQTLKPYDNWSEFGSFLKHPASLINFVAAYGTHSSITSALTLDAKRAAAIQLVTMGLDPASHQAGADAAHQDAYDFMHSLGAYANATHGAGVDGLMHTADDTFTSGGLDNALAVHGGWSTGNITGLDSVDLWIGGLAEKQNLFGGLLGSTFNFIFETQLESLQDGDRLYYLPRIEGIHFGSEIENNSFADMIIANTGAKHIPASIFLTPEYTVEASTVTDDPATWLKNPVTGAYLVEKLPDGTVHFIGDDNFFGNTMVLGGTEGNDRLQAGMADDDTVWGDGGDDWIDGGNGNDFLYGGDGNDTIVDSAGDDTIHGDKGNDTVHAGIGDDLVFGGDGNDLLDGGAGIDSIVGGLGNDIIYGGEDTDELEGNEGDDWIDGGAGGDLLVGDQGAPTGQQPLVSGNDVLDGGLEGDRMQGFDGDDIMLGQGGFDKFEGRNGFDWADFEKETHGVSTDMDKREFIPDPGAPAGDAVRDFYIRTEGVGGTQYDDFLEGTRNAKADTFNELKNVGLIFNLNTFFVGGQAYDWDATGAPVANATGYSTGDIMLGGAGNDTITGREGNDIIDGDAWLHVDLTRDANGQVFAGSEIIREIRFDTAPVNVDTAVYNDVRANYIISGPDAEGFITVSHSFAGAGGGITRITNDGVDRLRNIERLQFADVTISIDSSLTANAVPTGAVTITDSTPATPVEVGDTLTASNTLADLDGIVGPITYQWQELTLARPEWIAINNPSADSSVYKLTSFDLGNTIRVLATYTDGTGFHERVLSAPTIAVTLPTNVNTAPIVAFQVGFVGIPDTAARVGFPVNISLPLTTTFLDAQDPSNLLNFTATMADGTTLASHGLTFTLIPDPVNGGVSGATITGVVATPGPLEIKITATDNGTPGVPGSQQLSVTDNFIINVQTGNLAPVSAAPQIFNGTEDLNLSGQLAAGTDIDGPSALVFKLVPNSATNGQVLFGGNGAFVFHPNADFAGQATFQYVLSDGLTTNAPTTVTLNFAAVDDGQAALSITGVAAAGETSDNGVPSAAGGVLTAFLGPDPDGAISGASFQWYSNGVAIAGETTATHIVTAAEVGTNITVDATYTDGQNFTVTTVQTPPVAIGSVTIAGVDGAPVPTLVASNTLSDPDGGVLPGLTIYNWELSSDNGVTWTPANAADVSPDTLNLTLGGAAQEGLVRATLLFLDGVGNLESATSEGIHYVVAGNGIDVIVGIGEDDIIFAQGGNDTITGGLCTDYVDGGAGDDKFIATAGDGNDTYVGGDGIDTLVLTGAKADYTVVENPDGSYIITDLRADPAVSNGVDHLIGVELLQFTDVLTSSGRPVGVADSYSATEDNTLTVVNPNGVLANDIDGVPLTAQIVNNAANGLVTLNADGTFSYKPNANFAGTDTFTYVATNGTNASDPVTVTLNVAAVNDGAAAVTITGTVKQGQTLTAHVGADPDGAGTSPAFQWLRNGVVINGATAATYALVAADVGAKISVRASYTDGQNFAETPVSAQSATVTANVVTTINGTAGANTLNGGAGDEIINGLAGNDTITGNGGNDKLNGGDGNDTFFASNNDGNDTYDGGAGTDTYTMINTSAASTVDLSLGTATSATTGQDILISIENVTGSQGANSITGDGNANVLSGNGGNDVLNGGGGTDTLNGGTGNDTLDGGAGKDTLNGGAGNDILKASAGGDAYNGGAGTDTLDLSTTTNGVTVNLAAGTASGVDIGASTVSGIEHVIGGSGNDTITANSAPETFTGGLGADVFVYLTRLAAGNGATRSVITDFQHGVDHINLAGIDADTRPGGGAAGVQHFIFDGQDAAGSEARGHIGFHFETVAGIEHTIIEGNIRTAAPDAPVDFQIDLVGHIDLTATDFILS